MIMNSNLIHTLKYVINQTGNTLAVVKCNLNHSMEYYDTIECGRNNLWRQIPCTKRKYCTLYNSDIEQRIHF